VSDPFASAARLEPPALIAEARRQTNLHELGESVAEALGILCDSVERDAEPNLLGRQAIRSQIVGALVTRLRLCAHLNVQSSLVRRLTALPAPTVAPLIVTGLPRSGTTFLHQLLCLDPSHVGLPLWKLREPLCAPGPDDRRERLSRELALLELLAPSLAHKHRIPLDEPEECTCVLDASLESPSFWVTLPCYEYTAWCSSRSYEVRYAIYARLLEELGAAEGTSRLVLKSPLHLDALATLAQAIPHARFVRLHRDPVEVVPSLTSLQSSLYEPLTHGVDLPRLAAFNAHLLGVMLERSEAASSTVARTRVVDVEFRELVKTPEQTLRRIYDTFALPWPAGFDEAIVGATTAAKSDTGRGHKYSAEAFGQSREALAEQFADYRHARGYA
jgi:hypothetical protein